MLESFQVWGPFIPFTYSAHYRFGVHSWAAAHKTNHYTRHAPRRIAFTNSRTHPAHPINPTQQISMFHLVCGFVYVRQMIVLFRVPSAVLIGMMSCGTTANTLFARPPSAIMSSVPLMESVRYGSS